MAERGRPTKFTPELAAEICARISAGETLRQVCRSEGMPDERTVRRWAADDVEGFSPQYARAREDLLEVWAEEIVDICDDGTNDWTTRQSADGEPYEVVNSEHIQRSKLRVDTRKWLLSKLVPKKFGDKVQVAGDGGGPLVVNIVRYASDQPAE